MKPIMTYEIAMAASRDAANKAMHEAGRCAWNENDYNLACETFHRLYPIAGQTHE